jgi:hypothetical protein
MDNATECFRCSSFLEKPSVRRASLRLDIAAAEWMLDGIVGEDKKFVKRMLGIVQAFLLVTAFGLYRGNLGGKSHPFSYDRLTSMLDRFDGYPSHDVKAFA